MISKFYLERPDGDVAKASLMVASFSHFLSSSMGLPPGKNILGMRAHDSMPFLISLSVMVLPEIVFLSSLDDLELCRLATYGCSSGTCGWMGGGELAYPLLMTGVKR